jgi:hypothetical protein
MNMGKPFKCPGLETGHECRLAEADQRSCLRVEPQKYTHPSKAKGFTVEFLFKFPDIVNGKAH